MKSFQKRGLRLFYWLILPISLATLCATWIGDTPNKWIPSFTLAFWACIAAFGLLKPRYAQHAMTVFMFVTVPLYFVILYYNGILVLPLAVFVSVFAILLANVQIGSSVAVLMILSPLSLLWWHPQDINGVFYRIVIVNTFVPLAVYGLFRHLMNANRVLEEVNEKALKLATIKANFLANMSHEIRTPLNGVFGSLEVINQNANDEKTVKMFSEIGMSSFAAISQLVDNMLDINKISENMYVLNPTPQCLAPFLASCCKEYLGVATQKNIALTYSIEGIESDDYRLIDALRVRQVIGNLVSNAIKFTKEGAVTVSVKGMDDSPIVSIKVTDTGEGIPEAFHEKIYYAFEQVNPARLSQHRGSGLGLTIARHLVNMMDGTIEFESQVGKGSTFFVTLTLPRTAPPVDALKNANLLKRANA